MENIVLILSGAFVLVACIGAVQNHFKDRGERSKKVPLSYTPSVANKINRRRGRLEDWDIIAVDNSPKGDGREITIRKNLCLNCSNFWYTVDNDDFRPKFCCYCGDEVAFIRQGNDDDY